MKEFDFERLVPPMPDAYRIKMEQTLKEVEEMSRIRKHKQRITLALALVAVLLLATIGYAATQSNLLAHLFGAQQFSDWIRGQVVATGEVFEAEGVRLTIDEYLRTEDQLTVFWTVESTLEEPVLYCTTRPTINGEAPDLNEYSQDVNGHTLYLLEPGGHSTASGYVMVDMSDGLPQEVLEAKEITFALNACLYRPTKPIKRFPWTEMREQMREVVPDAKADHTTRQYPDNAYIYLVEDDEGPAWVRPSYYQGAYGAPDELQALIGQGLISLAGQDPVNLKVGAAAPARHTKPAQNQFELPGCDLEILELDFSDSSTAIAYLIIPEEQNVDEMQADELWGSGRPYNVMDDGGNMLLPALSEDGFEGWYSWVWMEMDEGRYGMYVEGKWAPAAQAPTQVTLVPSRYDATICDYAPICAERVTVPLELLN